MCTGLAAELFNCFGGVPGKWNWTFCVNVCTDGAAAMTGRLSGFTICKNVALECEATQCVIHENFLIF